MQVRVQADAHLEGTVERITFHNPENGFCVLRVDAGRKAEECITVVGSVPEVAVGSHIRCTGTWKQDAQYGLQFRAQRITTHLPESLEGIERYLGSGLIKGIGPAFAKAIVKTFGPRVWEVLDKYPEALKEVPKLGEKRAQCIQDSWKENTHIRQLLVFLHANGIGTQRATRIYKTLGADALHIIQADPYVLAIQVRGIGFKTADQLAQSLGISHADPARIRAGTLHVLQHFSSRGHSVVPASHLLDELSTLLGLEPGVMTPVVAEMETQKQIRRIVLPQHEAGTDAYMLPTAYYAEQHIAREMARLRQGALPWHCTRSVLDTYLDTQRFPLSEDQKHAIGDALSHKVMILTGGPGVGKTTIVRQIIRLVKSWGCDITLTAPTGRAAKRLTETTGFPAKTVHRLLRYDPVSHQFTHDRDTPLKTDYLVLDEASMLDIYLTSALLKAIPDTAAVLIVGDVDQLPSVGPGLVLHDLIQSQIIYTVRLTQIFRQARTSWIVHNAHRINEGLLPAGQADWATGSDPSDSEVFQKKRDFYWLQCATPESILTATLRLVTRDIPQRWGYNPMQDIQVLTPSRRSALGSVALNASLQPLLNRQHATSDTLERFGTRYTVGDKIIQLVNNYDKDVFNGDMGHIAGMDHASQTVWIRFEEREVEYAFTDLDEVQLAYAVTIHKSQGSEYPVVVIPITIQHFILLERNLLYTGITRGKKLVILVGDTKAVAVACRTVKAKSRVTHLPQLLNDLR